MSSVTEDTKVVDAADVATNPLLQSDDLPKFNSIEPSQLTPAMQSILEKLESDFAAMESRLVESKDAVAYDDVLPILEKMQHPLGFAWGIAGHLNGVKNTDELRKAYEENQPKIVKTSMKFSQSKPVYDALMAVQKGWESEEKKDDDFIMAQKQRAVSNSLRSMKLQGVGLAEGSPEQTRFNEIKLRFAELSTAFSNNVLDATKLFGLTVTDPKSLEGVPDSALAMWASAHQQHLIKEASDEEEKKKLGEADVDPKAGPWRITLDGPSYIAAMQHVPDRDIRKQVYIGYMTRASEFTADQLESKEAEKPASFPGIRKRKQKQRVLICVHGKRQSVCVECKGGSICVHGKQRYWCKECGGKAWCSHGKQKSRCVDCGGSGICQHGKIRKRCELCVQTE